MEMPKINLPAIQTKYKIAAAIGIIGMLLGFYYDHAYKPHAKKIAELNDSLKGLDDSIKIIRTIEYPKISNDKKILEKIEAKKKQIINDLNNRENKLPAKADYSGMLEKITRLAYRSGFDIKSLEPKDFTTRNGYQSLSLSMDISSRYSNLLDFLQELQPYPIYLENISISLRERPLLRINLNLFILFK
ncbi:MAG: type 4a pilus biogenesis protein PilO [Candidatus Omnitrophica bacterium]|nr:type 4a pilus biogenesis protein PilO [Candidatus Omnitrophota bacterium]